MAKQKSSEKDFINYFDRLPSREKFFVRTREILGTLASFYGFEAFHTSPIEDPKAFTALGRAGFLDDRPPVSCKTSAGTDILLRSSGILSILRAYVSHKLNDFPHPLKFLFSGESFYLVSNRTTGAQIRALPEWGLCMIGEEGSIAEAEIVQVIWKTLEKIGIPISSLNLRINATGCNECRQSFRSPFAAHFRSRAHRLCKNCKRHLKRNPTKILGCKEEPCRQLSQNTPQVLDYLCEVCKKHLRGVLEFLDEAKIPYFLDPKLFKDGTVFGTLVFECILRLELPPEAVVTLPPEIVTEAEVEAKVEAKGEGKEENAEKAEEIKVKPKENVFVLAEGGRVSRAGEYIVGRKIDMAAGVVLLTALEEAMREKSAASLEKPKVFLTQLGDLAKRKSLGLIEALRAGGISVQETLGRDSVKSQLKVAERVGAEIALILGQKEALDDTIIVREIHSGIQETIPQEKLIEFLKKKMRK